MSGILIPIAFIAGSATVFLSRYYRAEKARRSGQSSFDSFREFTLAAKWELTPGKSPHSFVLTNHGQTITLQFQAHRDLPAVTLSTEVDNHSDNEMWVFPVDHPYKSFSEKVAFEQKLSWTGDSDFDAVFTLHSSPRVFASSIFSSRDKLRRNMRQFPQLSLYLNERSLLLKLPAGKSTDQIHGKQWRQLIHILIETADAVDGRQLRVLHGGTA